MNTTTMNATTATYKTRNGLLYKSDINSWSPRLCFWLWAISALLFMLSGVGFAVGFGITVYLVLTAIFSKQRWSEYRQETQRQEQSDLLRELVAQDRAGRAQQ